MCGVSAVSHDHLQGQGDGGHGELVCSASVNSLVKVWQVSEDQVEGQGEGREGHDLAVTCIAHSASNRYVLSADR